MEPPVTSTDSAIDTRVGVAIGAGVWVEVGDGDDVGPDVGTSVGSGAGVTIVVGEDTAVGKAATEEGTSGRVTISSANATPSGVKSSTKVSVESG